MVAIILAILTRNVVPALFVGVWIGATMLSGWNPFLGLYATFNDFIIPSLGDEWNATVLLYCGLFGVLIVVFQTTGGAQALANAFANRIRSRKGAQASTGFLGLTLFIDDYFNALTVGSVMRSITDKLRVSREKLAYIVDSTSAPTCLLVPVSTWVVYVMGLIGTEFVRMDIDQSEYLMYLATIPFNYYAILAIFTVFIVIFLRFDYGPMAKAELRAVTTGKLIRDGGQPPTADEITQAEPVTGTPKIRNLLVPMFVLLALIPPLFLWTGNYPENSFVVAIGEADGGISILLAAVAAIFIALIMGVSQKMFSFMEAVALIMKGIKGMMLVFVILILAWSIGSVSSEVGTDQFLVNVAEESLISPALIPILIFIAGGIIAFTTGTSYGTFAIMIPIAIPLAVSMDISLPLAIAAVLSGGIFGDHCSPISDTSVLSSAGAASDHIDHVNTQLPYAITAGIVGMLCFFIAGITNSWWMALLTGLVTMTVVAFLLTKLWGQKIPAENQ
ncbi:Na+/H+ antiporter NhaC family protein [Geomicrobium sp. JCM 19039]|uniref:Na+/H+ antiporter NhaC family protein n=1 Tax=Geomicrobium sp. JCM 19039 TaxID=1460636 RepID=UPI00045F375F|nr:Na+/H+ antiporter NhaC family protein [Geomicrobium sp. JCM 19039]GAK10605.1 Na+/H+ antiporter NhaC [Geomicrobium sp. JCM 19039]